MKSSSIFIGNLPYTFEERDISNLFDRFGRLVQISVPMDRYTRRNRGFAFIEFEQRADAEDAYNKYNNYDIEGRKLRLDWDIGRPAKDDIRGPRQDDRRDSRDDRRDFRGDDRRDVRRSPMRDRSPMRGRSPMRDQSPRRDESAEEYR
jgi:RNA recognition motif-containing protein